MKSKSLSSNFLRLIFTLIGGSCLFSCKKFLDIPDPKNQLVSDAVFSSDKSALSAINGIYSDMMANSYLNGYITILSGLAADELEVSSTFQTNSLLQFENNSLQIDNPDLTTIWNSTFPYIYDANAIIEGTTLSRGMSAGIKTELEGEAKFIRAFCYFYLINFFGDVPLVLSTDYGPNALLGRSSVQSVYAQIEHDLKDAQDLLPKDYNLSNGEKIRPTKWAADALLARVYLFQGKWKNAKSLSDTLINSNLFNLDDELNEVFLPNSKEAIWQLMPVNPNFNTREGNLFVPALAAIPTFPLRESLVNSFEAGDKRVASWINEVSIGAQSFYYPFKYKSNSSSGQTEYYMVLRLSEQYLIRAEALAMEGNVPLSVADINTIRARADLLPISTNISADSCIAAIAHERQHEFFCEWGHRWLDLKRTGSINLVLENVKPGNWRPYDTLWPIPLSQLNANPNLTQNEGYK